MARLLAAWSIAAVLLVSASGSAARPRVDEIERPLRKFGFGSCNDQSLPQPLWPNILAHGLDLWIWMGDNIYADMERADRTMPLHPAPPETLRRLYAKLERHAPYAELVAKTPMLAIWDDHDYGQNDAGKHYPYREESQQIFLDFIGEPADSPRRQQKGIYASYVVGSGEQTVKFILLDNRYHRDDYGTKDGEILGAAQWKWLEDELAQSTAVFNVLVSGVQVVPTDRVPGTECWQKFPKQRERLLAAILRSQAKGVILLSGDVHYGELSQVRCGATTLTEVTTSGMTHSWMQFNAGLLLILPSVLFSMANALLPWEFRPSRDSFYGYLNWGTMEIDWDQPTPKATLRVLGEDDQTKLEVSVASVPSWSGAQLSLDQAMNEARACQPIHPMPLVQRRVRQYTMLLVAVAFIAAVLLTVIVLGCMVPWLTLRALLRRVFGKSKSTSAKPKHE